MHRIKQFAAVFLALALVLTVLPVNAIAADPEPAATEGIVEATGEVPRDAPAEQPTEAPTEPPATAAPWEPEETEAPTEAPTEPEETEAPTEASTQPKETEAPTEASTQPEETEAPTEPPETELPTEPTEPENPAEEPEPVTLKANTIRANLSLTVKPADAGVPEFAATEAELTNDEFGQLCETAQIPNVLGAFAADLTVTGAAGTGNLEILFSDPVPTLGESSTYVFFVRGAEARQITPSRASIAANGIVGLSVPLEDCAGSFRLVVLTSDQPHPLPWVTVTAGHCWQSDRAPGEADFAICLNEDRAFGSGDDTWSYARVTATNVSGDGSPRSDWIVLPESIRSKLMLLLFYGMDSDSPSSRFPANETTRTAMQRQAWEWVAGEADGSYTAAYAEHVSSCAAQMRNLVYTNPDNIDTSRATVELVWPNTKTQQADGSIVFGQSMIAVGKVVYSGKNISLHKSINASQACIDQIKDNAMYTLAGAEYTITVGGAVQEVLTTDASGNARSAKQYTPGTVVAIQETKAPRGFKLDSTVYSHTVDSGTNLIQVSDEPMFDPPFALTKVDRDTTAAQGNGSFSGAVFKWEYFDNYSWSGTAKRTWYFQTNANGRVGYDSSYLASEYTSDELYFNTDGENDIPLGTVKITEVKNSLGYVVIQQPLYCSILADSASPDGVKLVWKSDSWNILLDMASGNYGVYEPIDTEAFGSLTIQKLDKDFVAAPTWATLAGCEFTVYNRSASAVKIGDNIIKPGEVCRTLTVDGTGKASTGSIFPIGTYEVKESKGNDYYQCNEIWSYTFTVTGTEASPAFTAECPNTMYPAAIHLKKVDTKNNPLPGAKFLLEWSADGRTWASVERSQDIVMGGCSSPALDDQGCLIIGDGGTASFTGLYPAVYYRITEVEVPNGYQLLKEPILVDKLLPEDNFERTFRVVNNDAFALPKTGGTGTWKYGASGIALMAISCASVLLAIRLSPRPQKTRQRQNNRKASGIARRKG